jgi:hypothetical protein
MVVQEPRTPGVRKPKQGEKFMNSIGSRLAGVGLALFVVGLAGAGLAYAQTTEDSTTSTTSPPASAPAAPAEDPDCPEKGMRGGGRGGGGAGSSADGGSSVSPTPAPSSGTDPGAL